MAGTLARESTPAVARLANRSVKACDRPPPRVRGPSRAQRATAGRVAVIESDDGAVSFLLRAVDDRLFVERTHRGEAGTMAVQCLLIGGAEEFRRWCEVEPTRFEYPILFDRLLRCGDEVLRRRT